MTSTHEGATRTSVRQSFVAMLEDLLRRSSVDTGYTLGSIGYGSAVEVTLHKANAPFVVWLRPTSSPSGSYKETALFKIGYENSPPDKSGYTLLDAISAQVRQWEGSLPAQASSQLFDAHVTGENNVEVVAVRSGLKPAFRQVVHPDAIDSLVESLRGEGLQTCVTRADAYVSRFRCGFVPGETAILYAGRTEKAARTAADLERALMSQWRSLLRGSALERALGRALGYPPCCTEAFLKVGKLANDVTRFQALKRTGPVGAAPLNDVDDTLSLTSHLVCSYDCAPSIAYAEALMTELARANAQSPEQRRAAMQGVVVRFRDGGALRLTVESTASASRRRLIEVKAFGEGPLMPTWRAALADVDEIELADRLVRLYRNGAAPTQIPALKQEVQVRLFV